MTEKLATLLHDAAEQEFAALDPNAITRAGDKAVRRRRVLTGTAGVAVVAVVAGGVTALVSGSGDDVHIAGDTGIEVTDLTWVEGSVLHSADESVDLGFEVGSYARTGVGFVFTDREGGVYSYVDDEVSEIGSGAASESLVADPDDSLVGWIDDGAEPEFVVHDLASGEESRTTARVGIAAPGELSEPGELNLFDVDDRTAYWVDGGPVVAKDFDSRDERVLGDIEDFGWIADVEGDRMVRLAERRGGSEDLGMEVIDTSGEVLVGYEEAELATTLSPDARWVSMGEGAIVYEIETGRQVPLDVPGNDGAYFDGTVYEWLDGDTVALLHERSNDEPLDLLTCEVPAGDCTVVAQLDLSEGIGEGFLLPGRGWWG